MKTLFFGLFGFALPLPTLAASSLVTCTGPDCTFCSLAQLAKNVEDWLFMIIIPVGILLFAFAGLRLVMSQGDPGALNMAKAQLTKIIIGLVIMFASWTIVDTVLKLATGSDLGVWNPVSCGTQVAPGGITYPTPPVSVVGGVTSGTVGGGSNQGSAGTVAANAPSASSQGVRHTNAPVDGAQTTTNASSGMVTGVKGVAGTPQYFTSTITKDAMYNQLPSSIRARVVAEYTYNWKVIGWTSSNDQPVRADCAKYYGGTTLAAGVSGPTLVVTSAGKQTDYARYYCYAK